MENRCYNFLNGWILLQVSGPGSARFLQLLVYHNLILWNVDRTEDGYLFCMGLDDYWEIKPYVRKTGVHVVLAERHGLPFALLQARRHWSVVAGIFLLLCYLGIMSRFLWSITIDGNLYCTDDEILEFMSEEGITAGILLNKIPCEQLELDLRNQFPLITWVSAQIDGSVLRIHVKENETAAISDSSDDDAFETNSITAPQEGVIISITTRRGTPKVKAGDVVEEGQMLVSGVVTVYGDYDSVLGNNKVAADSDIIGRWQAPYQEKIDRSYIKKVYSETAKKGLSFQISSVKLLFCSRSEAQEIGIMEQDWNFLHIFSLGICDMYPYTERPSMYSDEELTALFEEHLLKYFKELEKNHVEILEKDGTISMDDSGGEADYILTLQGPFGVKVPISAEEEEGVTIEDEYH